MGGFNQTKLREYSKRGFQGGLEPLVLVAGIQLGGMRFSERSEAAKTQRGGAHCRNPVWFWFINIRGFSV